MVPRPSESKGRRTHGKRARTVVWASQARIMQGRARYNEVSVAQEPVYVGTDVSKATLGVGLRPTAQGWSAPNDEKGDRRAGAPRALRENQHMTQVRATARFPSVIMRPQSTPLAASVEQGNRERPLYSHGKGQRLG